MSRDGDPRRRLTTAALDVVREVGIAGVSARSVARAGGFSQSLIYHHYDSIEALLVDACAHGSEERVTQWRDALGRVDSLAGLVDLAERLHADEDAAGNVAVLAQFLAGSQTHPPLRDATRDALDVWTREIGPVISRLLGDGPVADVVDPTALTDLVADAFVGIELAGATRDDAALRSRFATLRRLVGLVESLASLGPVATSMVRRRLT